MTTDEYMGYVFEIITYLRRLKAQAKIPTKKIVEITITFPLSISDGQIAVYYIEWHMIEWMVKVKLNMILETTNPDKVAVLVQKPFNYFYDLRTQTE